MKYRPWRPRGPRRPKMEPYIPNKVKEEIKTNILVNIELKSEINELFAKTKVIQQFKNPLDNNSLELKIYVYKKIGLLFSSFSCKIGDSIMVKSKVIKKEKVEEKYSDSISKGNAAIFVSDDPENENRIIINMGNIPPKEEVIFTSEFIHLIESSKSYEFELFRNFPIFQGNGAIYKNSKLEGNIHIKTTNKLLITEKQILMKNLKIKTEKYENKERNNYIISYEIDDLPKFSPNNLDYIPSSKIYFKIDNDNDNESDIEKPIIYTQKSTLDKQERNYYIQYNIKTKKIDDDQNTEVKPALFIFLIDQSGSMSGSPIRIASNALKLFIQSLPSKSYYQVIGFGSTFVKYDKIPKEYIQNNIDESLNLIDKLKADLCGTDIYSPLKDIYDSYELYDKIDLPKNIFLLTDGEILDKDKTLGLIEKNSSKFSVYSIGIGHGFDEDLIKNAGILGKGGYNFCYDLNELNKIIAKEINKAISPYISKLNIKTTLDTHNIIKNNNNIPNIIREDEIINLNYITNNEKNDAVKININYIEDDKNIEKNYEIIPLEILEGEEFSKLIINNYLLNNSDLSKEEKIKLALKYQIFTNDTSLFAEVELSENISKEMKSKIIGDKKNNIILKPKPIYDKKEKNNYLKGICLRRNERYNMKETDMFFGMSKSPKMKNKRDRERSRSRSRENNMNKGTSLFGQNLSEADYNDNKTNLIMEDEDYCMEEENCLNENVLDSSKEKKENFIGESKRGEKTINLDEKEKVMKMIRTQDFNKGNWNENVETKKIKEKYKIEYDLLKRLNNDKINDNVAITIIIIYFIYKEYSELLSELSMIIKKAKNYIKKETKNTYENIIKQICIK